jgi:ADP-heptose:LPS heptosyltransferase
LLRLADAVATACAPNVGLPRNRALRSADVATQSGRKIVCIHPGVGSPIRQWPAAHFAILIDRLASSHHVEIILIGSDDEAEIAAEVMARVERGDVVRSLVGRIGLRELPQLLASAALFVGNNSGPKHLAASLGVPTVGIHSGTVDAREWGPIGSNAVAVRRDVLCSPCYFSDAGDCPRQLACLTELQPSDVYEICDRLLAIDAAS